MFWYHAVADFDSRRRFFWNRDRDELISDLLIPLLSGQVVAARRRGKKSLFNFGAVSYFTIIKTKHKLVRERDGQPPRKLKNRMFVNAHNVTEEFVTDMRAIQASPLTRSLLQQALSKPLKQIFVIMRFGNKVLDSAYFGVIKPVAKSFGYDVLRIDEVQDSGNISTQILENIASSAIVIAELSGGRPNCYYEAGYAHALGKEMIFLIQKRRKFTLTYRLIDLFSGKQNLS